jgi:hypothetical protein
VPASDLNRLHPSIRRFPAFVRGFSLLSLVSLLSLLAACRTPEEGAKSGPTIDVEPKLEVSTDDDVIEVRHANTGLSGILPGDFPGDIPLVLPASLVDYGDEGGAPYIELTTSKGRQAVEQNFLSLLYDRGWTLLEGSGQGTPGELRLAKDTRPLRIVFKESGSGSLYRIVY